MRRDKVAGRGGDGVRAARGRRRRNLGTFRTLLLLSGSSVLVQVLAALPFGVVLLLLSSSDSFAREFFARTLVPVIVLVTRVHHIVRQAGASQDLSDLLDSFAVLELWRMLLGRAIRPDTRRPTPAIAGAVLATEVALHVAPLRLDHQVVDATAFAHMAQVTDLKRNRPTPRVALGCLAGRLRRLPVSEKLTGPLVAFLSDSFLMRAVLVVWNEAAKVTSDPEAFALHRAVCGDRVRQRLAGEACWRDDARRRRPVKQVHKVGAGIVKLDEECSRVEVSRPDIR